MVEGQAQESGIRLLVDSEKRKRSYKSPKLTEYGNVTQLTTGMNGSHFDTGHNNNTKKGAG